MLNAFKAALDSGYLTTSQRRGVITLIPKPSKDPELLKNLRPITLLNQDYKYLTKLEANRIKEALPTIISSDQTGFMADRYIGYNIQRIMNLIELCKEEDFKGILVNIDFGKAFDSLE